MITNTYKVTGKVENREIEQCRNKLIWHNIVFPTEYENHKEPEKAAFMYELIRKFLKTIGDKYKGQIVIDPRSWIGKELAIKIKHDKWMAETKEKVHYVLTIDNALEITSS